MEDEMSQLLFAKQLSDNAEFANEDGLLNLLRIIEAGSDDVVNGTSFAPGAREALKVLIENRPDLFSDRVMRGLEERARGTPGNGRSAAELALKTLKRPKG